MVIDDRIGEKMTEEFEKCLKLIMLTNISLLTYWGSKSADGDEIAEKSARIMLFTDIDSKSFGELIADYCNVVLESAKKLDETHSNQRTAASS